MKPNQTPNGCQVCGATGQFHKLGCRAESTQQLREVEQELCRTGDWQRLGGR